MKTMSKESLTLQDLGIEPQPAEDNGRWWVLPVLFATAMSAGAVLVIATVAAALMMVVAACAKGLRTQGMDQTPA